MHRKYNENKDEFLAIADKLVIYNLRKSWLGISKVFNEMAAEKDGTLSTAFVLLTINEEEGTPVTKIAPRMGMEPNSLSRILKTLEAQNLIVKRKDKLDKRKTYICLTELGVESRKLAIKAVFNLEKEITNQFSKSKLESFFKVIKEIPQIAFEYREKELEK